MFYAWAFFVWLGPVFVYSLIKLGTMKKRIIPIILALCIATSSCELLEGLADETKGITNEEIVEGLKTALEIGTDTATNILGHVDGYYKNPLVKIPLPPDVVKVKETIENNSSLNSIASSLNLYKKFDDVELAVNRAAEFAADSAKPIFKKAITQMSLTDAWDILNGTVPQTEGTKSAANASFDSAAATQYFINNTYTDLTNLFSPKINYALDQDISSLNFSAVDAWSALTTTYNTFRSNGTVVGALAFASLAGKPINLPQELDTDLGHFCTEKALTGLFYRVGLEEKKIRRNPFDWAMNIIQKVFGKTHEKPVG
jgi:hypothetical protein